MRSAILTAILLSGLFIIGCGKMSDANCHAKLTFKNNSAGAVIIANEIGATNYFCNLRGEICAPGATYDFTAATGCWEKELTGSQSFELYAVDPAHYNVDTCYSHDSIYVRNTILKHFTISPSTLQSGGFQIAYP